MSLSSAITTATTRARDGRGQARFYGRLALGLVRGIAVFLVAVRLRSGLGVTLWPSLPDLCRRSRAGQLWYEGEATGWLGLADEIPLTEVAAEVGQQLQGGVVLDSFGHDAQTDGVAEVDGRANEVEGASTVAVGEPSDEDSIEFEFLHRQAAEVGE